MDEAADGAVDLVVTSPPYWNIKDYGMRGQIGHGQTLHEYLRSLFQVWRECGRVLRGGGRLCVNIGDQFARASIYGRYRVIPLHAEIIVQAEALGLDFLGSIIWQKKTTVNASGGAVIMGSFPFPPNGIVELDYEHILIFKKPGKPKKADSGAREASRMSKEEWKSLFRGHWSFGGAGKARAGHEAPFPEELPRRLIRMFSFAGDTILDPFLGSGTTAKAGLELGRNVLGYEINPAFAKEAVRRLKAAGCAVETVRCPARTPATAEYAPGIQNARPEAVEKPRGATPELHTAASITKDCAIVLENGARVRMRGLKISDGKAAAAYLEERIRGKKIFLRDRTGNSGHPAAYVYLKNRIFVNAHLLKTGAAVPDGSAHRLRARFEAWSGGDGRDAG